MRISTLARNVTRAAAVAAGFVLLAALNCVEDKVTEVVGAAGTYTLQTVNGSAVPFTVPGSNPAIVVQSGTISLGGQSSGPYTVRVAGTRGGTAQDLLGDGGQFSAAGSSITFTSSVLPAPSNTFAGTLTNGNATLTFTVTPPATTGFTGAVTLAFRRN